MLTLTGRGKTQTCDGITRRDFMQIGTLGGVGLSMPSYLAAKEAGAIKPGHDERACIMIFNLGAPSHLDLWDMKPDAAAEVRGPFNPVDSNVPGMQLSEILPRHAKIADKFSLVRSCHHLGGGGARCRLADHANGPPISQAGCQTCPTRVLS